MMNPVTELPGPAFLVFYGCVIGVVTLWARHTIRGADPTRNEPPPAILRDPDPYKIAFLQGGENEVARLAIFDLLEAGYLERGADNTIQQRVNRPSAKALSPIQADVFSIFASPKQASDAFGQLPAHFAEHCGKYEARLRGQQLLCMPETRAAARRVWRIAAAIVVGLGLYRLYVAHSQGHGNVWFLLGMGAIATAILAAQCTPPRVSARGQGYLTELKTAYGRQQVSAWLGDELTAPLLLASVFGAGALAGTPYAYYEELFPKKAKQQGGVCGVACGIDSGGGGGGGGCGGCGGGCGG